jgi:hypothetical protein
MYTHSPDPSKQYAILRKIRGSRDQAIPGYFAPQEQIPWVRGWVVATPTKSLFRRPKNEVTDDVYGYTRQNLTTCQQDVFATGL